MGSEGKETMPRVKPPVVTRAGGFPIYAFGRTYIYGVSPDFETNVLLQEGNNRRKVKIKPKKSWEITSNPYGVTICEPGPRSPWNDSQPFHGVGDWIVQEWIPAKYYQTGNCHQVSEQQDHL